MSIEMILILGAIALEIPIAKAIERKAREEIEERAGERAKEALQEAETLRMEEEAREVVRVAHLALKGQHAAGYGPWLASLLRRVISFSIRCTGSPIRANCLRASTHLP